MLYDGCEIDGLFVWFSGIDFCLLGVGFCWWVGCCVWLYCCVNCLVFVMNGVVVERLCGYLSVLGWV